MPSPSTHWVLPHYGPNRWWGPHFGVRPPDANALIGYYLHCRRAASSAAMVQSAGLCSVSSSPAIGELFVEVFDLLDRHLRDMVGQAVPATVPPVPGTVTDSLAPLSTRPPVPPLRQQTLLLLFDPNGPRVRHRHAPNLPRPQPPGIHHSRKLTDIRATVLQHVSATYRSGSFFSDPTRTTSASA